MSDHKRFLMALATFDIPRLHHLIRIAIKQGLGVEEIISRIEEAAKRLYNVKSFTLAENKFMRLIKRLAGRKAVYAMSKFLGLPSASTIRESNPPKLLPSVGVPKPSEIAANITTFFGVKSTDPPSAAVGHCLMLDGIHLCQRCRWHRPTNRSLGLCREHSSQLDLGMKDMDSVLAVLDAVHGDSPTTHYGREATVGAIGRFGPENYHALPILQTQTCKSEKGKDFAELLELILEQWKIHGAPQNGPILTVAMDGDSLFRAGAIKVLMCDELKEMSELYQKLQGLAGLNLECSKDKVVSAPDPKHVTKRQFLSDFPAICLNTIQV
jgi:hypothetical protein